MAVPVVADPQAPSGSEVVPPGPRLPGGLIRFDPDAILKLAREHRHPEWVVCPRIERLVLSCGEAWEADPAERKELVAHRDERQAKRVERLSRDPGP
jgi:hypothetical protein